MDPDLVRQQEEAERAANGAAKKAVGATTDAAVLEPLAADVIATPAAMAETIETHPGAAEPAAAVYIEEASPAVADAVEEPAGTAPLPPTEPAAPKKAANPNRRALPPMGTGRRPGDEPGKRRRLRGMLRLLVFVLVGALIGGGAGFAAVNYLGVSGNEANIYLYGSLGGFALIAGLIGLLHYDDH